jgi:putative transcriptional regulator
MVRILLSRLLGELRWTQADLARSTDIRPSTINDIFHEIAERINLEHLDLICEALGCEISDILVREPNIDSRTKPRSGKIPVRENPPLTS